uniref:Uncharacterized protein n=1 Tax=Glossina austeni TaxID=7395 RepID=A0A1A9VR13_GLOAU
MVCVFLRNINVGDVGTGLSTAKTSTVKDSVGGGMRRPKGSGLEVAIIKRYTTTQITIIKSHKSNVESVALLATGVLLSVLPSDRKFCRTIIGNLLFILILTLKLIGVDDDDDDDKTRSVPERNASVDEADEKDNTLFKFMRHERVYRDRFVEFAAFEDVNAESLALCINRLCCCDAFSMVGPPPKIFRTRSELS